MIDDKDIVGAVIAEMEEVHRAPNHVPTHREGGWSPDHNRTQKIAFNDPAPHILLYAEKASGKTILALDMLVRHAYENFDALCLIIAPAIRTGKEGVLYDLTELVLPRWRDGNRDPKTNELVDEGIGLEYTEAKMDPQTKDRVLFIGNRFGGWSKVILVSIPYAEAVHTRMRALSPSFVMEDEGTALGGIEYFTYVTAQLGRRRHISGPQQFVMTCNPEGPSHWVHKVFFQDCVDKDTGKRDPSFSVYHVKIEENLHRLPPGYIDRLKLIYRDPIQRRRLLDGEWIDQPSGEAIFKDYFIPEIHVRGNALKGIGLMPNKGFPIICGVDPGPVNFSMHMEQMLPTKKGIIWTVFDELNLVGMRLPNFAIVPRILAKMDYWNKLIDTEFRYDFISDEAAFNQARTDGSYDALEIQKLGAGRIRMRACPKGNDTVPARVRLVADMMLQEQVYISATCRKTLDMMRLLESKEVKQGQYDANAGFIPRDGPYKHPFDSMSYPMFFFAVGGRQLAGRTAQVKSEFYEVGSR